MIGLGILERDWFCGVRGSMTTMECGFGCELAVWGYGLVMMVLGVGLGWTWYWIEAWTGMACYVYSHVDEHKMVCQEGLTSRMKLETHSDPIFYIMHIPKPDFQKLIFLYQMFPHIKTKLL